VVGLVASLVSSGGAQTGYVAFLLAQVALTVALRQFASGGQVPGFAAVVTLAQVGSGLIFLVLAFGTDVSHLAAIVTPLAIIISAAGRGALYSVLIVGAVAFQVVGTAANMTSSRLLGAGGTASWCLTLRTVTFDVVGATAIVASPCAGSISTSTSALGFALASTATAAASRFGAVTLQVVGTAARVASAGRAISTAASAPLARAHPLLGAVTTNVASLAAVVALTKVVPVPDRVVRTVATNVTGATTIVAGAVCDAVSARRAWALTAQMPFHTTVPARHLFFLRVNNC